MGWKASMIIVHPAPAVTPEEVLRTMGYASYERIGDQTLESVINPDDNEIYIGTYRNNLVICAPEAPLMSIMGESREVDALVEKFPASEICSVILHSVVNMWGYAVIKDGRQIRSRLGSAESGTHLDEGEPQEEEKELLSRSTMGDDGQRTYTSEHDGESMTEDQVGENFVFALTARYFGEPLDQSDELLFQTKLTGYALRKNQPVRAVAADEAPGTPVADIPVPNHTKKWTFYVGLFLILVAIRVIIYFLTS